MAKRDNRIDNLKYQLIFMVVFGHVTQFTLCNNDAVSVQIVRKLIHTIYLFHMPLFIIISGYFSKKKMKNEFWAGIFRLAKVYIIFHIFWIVLGFFRGDTISLRRFICPSFTLWYIHCLVFWRILLQYIPNRILNNTFLSLFICSIVSVLGGFIPISEEFALQRFFTFMPFFFLGYHVKKNGWLEKVFDLKWYYCIVPVVLIIFENQIYLDIWGRTPYDSLFDVARRFIYLVSATIISCAVVRLLPLNNILFAKEGKDVLFYYIYHSVILFIIALLLRHLGIYADGGILIFISLMTMLALFFLRKVSFLHIPLR